MSSAVRPVMQAIQADADGRPMKGDNRGVIAVREEIQTLHIIKTASVFYLFINNSSGHRQAAIQLQPTAIKSLRSCGASLAQSQST